MNDPVVSGPFASGPAPRARVVLVDGIPMSGLVCQAENPRAVIVAVHGGATSAAYFDCPGRPQLSLLRIAAAHGFTAIALDRPGYGASAVYAGEFRDPATRVASAYRAVDKILGDGDRGAGVFLLGHSAGCELALRMATAGPEVVGVEIAGTGLRYSPTAKEIIGEATLTSRPAGLRDLLWQPTELYPPEVLTGALSAPGVAYEAKVTKYWTRQDFPEIASQVKVPVEFSVAEHESVWQSTPEARATIAGLFTSSPRVVVNEVKDSGHNVSVALSAEVYHRTVLSFFEQCIVTSPGRDPEHVEAG